MMTKLFRLIAIVSAILSWPLGFGGYWLENDAIFYTAISIFLMSFAGYFLLGKSK